MLFKAHRCCKAVDIHDFAAPILRSLTKDENSHRSRGVKPGETIIYDEIHDEGTRFTITGPNLKPTQDIPQYLFYDEVDALEDEIIFPEECLGGDNYIAVGESTNGLEQLERRRQLHPTRFALDLDTDEELPDEDEDEEDNAYTASEDISSEEHNGRGCDVGTDPTPPEREVPLVKTYDEVVNGEALSLKPSKLPVVTFCNELNIPPEDNFPASICRELAIPNGRYTRAMTTGEKVAFKLLFAQYKSSSSASTVPDMSKIYEKSVASESSKCKDCIGVTDTVVLNAVQFSRKRGIKPT